MFGLSFGLLSEDIFIQLCYVVFLLLEYILLAIMFFCLCLFHLIKSKVNVYDLIISKTFF